MKIYSLQSDIVNIMICLRSDSAAIVTEYVLIVQPPLRDQFDVLEWRMEYSVNASKDHFIL